jgi:hypothetical protein
VPVNVATVFQASFVDGNVGDTHGGNFDWGAGAVAGSVSEWAGAGTVSLSHAFTVPGVYTITATVTDGRLTASRSSTVDFPAYVVVYDPAAGFVTGGGWINSPVGAYKPDPSLAGKATFGFESKYKKGANAPIGNTEFYFKAAALTFHSSNYEWLVVTGRGYAQYKGTGTISGMGDYKFMLWAGDGSPDTFRIRIWEEHGATAIETDVYDNGFDQAIGGGSIVVHTK